MKLSLDTLGEIVRRLELRAWHHAPEAYADARFRARHSRIVRWCGGRENAQWLYAKALGFWGEPPIDKDRFVCARGGFAARP